jgi:hypothetical protein
VTKAVQRQSAVHPTLVDNRSALLNAAKQRLSSRLPKPFT